jgi:hypothetical protein
MFDPKDGVKELKKTKELPKPRKMKISRQQPPAE